jgi:hypothetical protein
VRPRSGAPGEDIVVAARTPGGDAGTLCANLPERPAAAFTDPASPDNFYGIVGSHLLVDSGTGPRGRTLRVVELSGGTVALQTTYEEPVSLDDGVLEFSEPVGGFTDLEGVVGTGVNCPDAQEWFDTGFGVGVNRVVRYRLSDGTREDTDQLVCVPLQ